MGGAGLTANKICFNHFVLLCYVCSFITGQYHSGNNIWVPNLELLEQYIFLKVKSATEFDPCKCTISQRMLLMLSFTYMMNQNITSVADLYRGNITLHSTYKINYHEVLFLESEAPKCPWFERYMYWNVSWPASTDSLVKTWLSLLLTLYPNHCGMSLHQAPMFYFTAKCLGSF